MSGKRATAILVFLLLTIPLLIGFSPPVMNAEAAPPGTPQTMNIFLGGTPGSESLTPFLDGTLRKMSSSGILTARDGIMLRMTTTIGRWNTPTSVDGFSFSGPCEYSFWLAGDVEGVYLQINLYLGDEIISSHTTEPVDLFENPKIFNGTLDIPATIRAGSNTPLSVSVAWGGGQNIVDSITNNTVELWYGLSSFNSGISLKMAAVTITDASSERHPEQDDTLVFTIKASSLFGPGDLADVEIAASITQGVLSDVQETVEGIYKVFTASWAYKELSFPGGVFNVTLGIRDYSGNLWDKASSLAIIFPEESVDLSISYSQVGIVPTSPRVGDNVEIRVHFTGTGKNWGSVPARVRVFENERLLSQQDVTAVMGNNGPFLFNWTPESPGEHLIAVVLDESLIDAPGLNATNNVVERMVTVLPAQESGAEETESGIPPYMTIMAAIIFIVVISAVVSSAIISSSKRKKEEKMKYRRAEGKVVPLPSYAPSDSPSGFFIHSQGKPSVWVDTSNPK